MSWHVACPTLGTMSFPSIPVAPTHGLLKSQSAQRRIAQRHLDMEAKRRASRCTRPNARLSALSTVPKWGGCVEEWPLWAGSHPQRDSEVSVYSGADDLIPSQCRSLERGFSVVSWNMLSPTYLAATPWKLRKRSKVPSGVEWYWR